MTRIFITGIAGFIGSHLAIKLVEEGHIVSGMDNFSDLNYNPDLKYDRIVKMGILDGLPILKADIRSFDMLLATIEGFQPDVIVHLGAYAGVRQSMEKPKQYLDNNVIGTMNIFEVAKILKVPVVYASSSSVYGEYLGEAPESFDITKTSSIYGLSKAVNEMLAFTYYQNYKIKSVGLRYFTAYGEWGRPDMALWIFTKAIMEGEKLPLNNGGEMHRDWTYVEDIVDGTYKAIQYVLNSDVTTDVFNLGSGRTTKLIDFVKIIEKECDKKAIIQNLPLPDGDVLYTKANIDHAKEILKYKPKTTIHTGIKRFVKWYMAYTSK